MHNDSIRKKLLYGLCGLIPDELFLKLKFRKNFGRWPDFRNPKTFNEKLNWLKLHDRRPEYTRMVDKAEAKRYVAERIGEEYVIPTYGVWDRAEDIDFDALPDKFVMKATHDSGRVIICRDKSQLDIDDARQAMRESLRRNFYAVTREWPYKNVKPRIIAEQLLESNDDIQINDYKFFCFNGKVRYMKIDFDRNINHRANYFDADGRIVEWGEAEFPPDLNRNKTVPDTFGRMKQLAERFSAGFPFLRVDFYSVNGRIYFGELTFFPNSGMGKFTGAGVDLELGNLIDLRSIVDCQMN